MEKKHPDDQAGGITHKRDMNAGTGALTRAPNRILIMIREPRCRMKKS
jgi:hypothetical protein